MCADRVLADLQVEVSKLDVADMEEAKGVVALAQKQAPVGGIFHLAMILQDRWMANQVSSVFLAAARALTCKALCTDVRLKDAAISLRRLLVQHLVKRR